MPPASKDVDPGLVRILKVHQALAAVMRQVPVVKKEDRNAAQNFNFRGIDATLNAVGPALRDNGVIVLPTLLSHESDQVLVGRNQTPMRSVTVLVQYTFVGPEGDMVTATVPGEAMDSGDKAYSKAMSVAFRTALLQALALPTDERDPDADSHERSENTPPKKTAADIARDDLLIKVTSLKYEPAEVAKLYYSDMGTQLRDETDDRKIADFTTRLGEKKLGEKK